MDGTAPRGSESGAATGGSRCVQQCAHHACVGHAPARNLAHSAHQRLPPHAASHRRTCREAFYSSSWLEVTLSFRWVALLASLHVLTRITR